MKIIINKCFGGFSLSNKAKKLLPKDFNENNKISRIDQRLISVIEKLGVKANGDYSELKVIEIPNDVDWIIEEYDGCEWVAEKHKTWS